MSQKEMGPKKVVMRSYRQLNSNISERVSWLWACESWYTHWSRRVQFQLYHNRKT